MLYTNALSLGPPLFATLPSECHAQRTGWWQHARLLFFTTLWGEVLRWPFTCPRGTPEHFGKASDAHLQASVSLSLSLYVPRSHGQAYGGAMRRRHARSSALVQQLIKWVSFDRQRAPPEALGSPPRAQQCMKVVKSMSFAFVQGYGHGKQKKRTLDRIFVIMMPSAV